MDQHPLWCLPKRASGTLPKQPVHPASPILLTSTGPLSGLDSEITPPSLRLQGKRGLIARLKFESKTRRINRPITSNHSLDRTKLVKATTCYPEGYFGGNQLLSVSMSLSPLHPGPTTDFHVRTMRGPPPGFLPASTTPGVGQRFSGLSPYALDAISPEADRSVVRLGSLRYPGISLAGPWGHLHCALDLVRSKTRIRAELLGPCFKTGRSWSHNSPLVGSCSSWLGKSFPQLLTQSFPGPGKVRPRAISSEWAQDQSGSSREVFPLATRTYPDVELSLEKLDTQPLTKSPGHHCHHSPRESTRRRHLKFALGAFANPSENQGAGLGSFLGLGGHGPRVQDEDTSPQLHSHNPPYPRGQPLRLPDNTTMFASFPFDFRS